MHNQLRYHAATVLRAANVTRGLHHLLSDKGGNGGGDFLFFLGWNIIYVFFRFLFLYPLLGLATLQRVAFEMFLDTLYSVS